MTNEKEKNQDFIQLYRGYITELADMASDNATAYKLFMLICKHMDGLNALVVSNKTLAEILNISTRTVQRCTKYLQDKGWICIFKSGTTNIYVVNPQVAWTSYNYQKKYCQFKANTLISHSENPDYIENPKSNNFYKVVNNELIKKFVENYNNYSNRNNYIP